MRVLYNAVKVSVRLRTSHWRKILQAPHRTVSQSGWQIRWLLPTSFQEIHPVSLRVNGRMVKS